VTTQVWVDDSGTKGTDTLFVFASIGMTAEEWAAFSEEWGRRLAAPPTIRYFKWDEAVGCHGEFRRLSGPERDTKVRSLVGLINAYRIRVLPLVVDLEGFEQTVAQEFPKPLNHPYFWSCHNLILSVATDLYRWAGQRERFEIVFDEQVIFAPRVKLYYPFTQIMAAMHRPEIAPILPNEPLFRDDKQFMPLQAADLFAGLTRAFMSDKATPLGWVRESLPNIVYSPERRAWERGELAAFVKLAKANIPPGVTTLSREMFD